MKRIRWITAVFFLNSLMQAQPVDSIFHRANELYRQGNYEKALEQYRQIPARGFHSSDLYFNMGNAYYKLNRIPWAIYYYEKALKLDPRNNDAKNNLQIARRGIQDRIQRLPESFTRRMIKKIYMLFSPDTWAWLAVISLLTGWVAFVVYLYSRKPAIKRLFFTLFLIFLSLLPVFWQMGYRANRELSETYAIVMVPKSTLYTEPNLSSEKTGIVHEGLKVQIIEPDGDWYKIKLPDGKIAWITANEIKKI